MALASGPHRRSRRSLRRRSPRDARGGRKRSSRSALFVALAAHFATVAATGAVRPRGLLVETDAGFAAAELTVDEAEKLLPVRAKNYWSIKAPRHPYWIGQASTDERGHAYFEDAVYSARAFFRLMRTYRYVHGLRSIQEIVSRFTPPTDTIGSIPGNAPNPTSRFAAFIAARLGIQTSDDLELFREDGSIDREIGVRLARAFAAWELGARFLVSEALILEGISRAED